MILWHQTMYRYGKRSHVDDLLQRGRIRIGTLHDFRRAEHRRGISDPKEGKRAVHHHFENFDSKDLNSGTRDAVAMKAFSDAGVFKVSGPGLKMERVTIEWAPDLPDCYVLCASRVNSRYTMAQFEGADACARVVDVTTFLRVITEALSAINPVEFGRIDYVHYEPRRRPWNGRDWGHHPVWIKEPEFEPQAEVRAAWQPLNSSLIEPEFVEDSRLAACCIDVTPTS